jgi:hypothetical protein
MKLNKYSVLTMYRLCDIYCCAEQFILGGCDFTKYSLSNGVKINRVAL